MATIQVEEIKGGDNPENSGGSGNLSGTENDKLEENGIKELAPNEITNENLKDNDNIKGVITGEVPIPVGGEYKEGTKETGVVVTMGESEFVWVSVENIDEMAVLQAGSDANYQGVLYDFNGTTATKRALETIGSGIGSKNMVESVKKYKGFYIGRYETSIDVEKKQAYSKVGVLPATAKADIGKTWYGLYAYQKKMAEANGYTSVESYMVWRM